MPKQFIPNYKVNSEYLKVHFNSILYNLKKLQTIIQRKASMSFIKVFCNKGICLYL